MIKNQKWIKADFAKDYKTCPVFRKEFDVKDVKKATLEITAKGIYNAEINGKKVSDAILAPGFTVYKYRHQYQTYDITDLLAEGKNTIDVTVSAFWYHGRIVLLHNSKARETDWDAEIIGLITLEKKDGSVEYICTDGSWTAGTGPVEFADIYDGEIYNATKEVSGLVPVVVDENASTDMLIPQEGEAVKEHDVFTPIDIITTPNGETVLDFGQNLTGYPEITVNAKAGEQISLSFAEILDKNGNFYNDNYRSALCQYIYTCKDGLNVYKPGLTFYGFRYLRVDKFPESAVLSKDNFKAIAIYSDFKKTGSLSSGHAKLNQLFHNIFWGQRCNLVDIPTDCPQRDERLGWTGDAQVIAKAASYCFDLEKFFTKWLRDLKCEQDNSGNVSFIVPNLFEHHKISTAWSDAAVIIPWQVYAAYGDKELLKEMLPLMEGHLDAIVKDSGDLYAWKTGANTHQFGDWLGMDAPAGSYRGSTNPELIQAAYYVYDISLVIKAYEALGLDATEYKERYAKAKERFNSDFTEYKTQTECVLALHFDLAYDKAAVANKLAEMVHSNGDKLTTGFVGTPYLLHALSDNGYADLAYTLLLQEGYPSWLFSVNMGATTMWEHWDGVNEKGDVWSRDMNSFNHYAYGAVADWVYEFAAGIKADEAGFAKVTVEPHPDERLGSLDVSIDTRNGKVSSKWIYKNGKARYEITVPVDADIVIEGKKYSVTPGTYMF